MRQKVRCTGNRAHTIAHSVCEGALLNVYVHRLFARKANSSVHLFGMLGTKKKQAGVDLAFEEGLCNLHKWRYGMGHWGCGQVDAARHKTHDGAMMMVAEDGQLEATFELKPKGSILLPLLAAFRLRRVRSMDQCTALCTVYILSVTVQPRSRGFMCV